MCFSASASFTASAVLLVVGLLALRLVRRPREAPFAAIPLVFAVQQFTEGAIWLTVQSEESHLDAVMTHAYSFFSHVFWPAFVPLAVLLIEPPGWRRRAMRVFVAAGMVVGAYLLYILIAYPVESQVTGRHIEYVSPHFFAPVVMTLYLMSIALSLLLSTHRMVMLFGVLAVLSFAVAYLFYTTWFISVWCFFAAVLSVVVYGHFRWQKDHAGEPKPPAIS